MNDAIYGRNAVYEALRGRRAETVSEIWASERIARERWLAGRQVRIATAAEVSERCGSSAHQGICASVGEYPYADAAELLGERDPLIVVLDHVEDPQNLGAICRTAECAGVSGVVIHERRSASVTPAVCKASAGAVEHLRLAQVRNIADFLGEAKRASCWSYGAVAPDREGGRTGPIPYTELDYSGGVLLVLGSEGDGLRPRVASACDQLISLPMHGRVQSLGVSAATAAILYGILQDRARRA
ncbi:MAG TPA: 23S rRNA (guanosine(2251)-2'-O)-methyltransferase RlmB [Solirubrobacteraceae bacterium]|jgi:23S rRNA (guanosine2251-2'-O)-methyltransferase